MCEVKLNTEFSSYLPLIFLLSDLFFLHDLHATEKPCDLVLNQHNLPKLSFAQFLANTKILLLKLCKLLNFLILHETIHKILLIILCFRFLEHICCLIIVNFWLFRNDKLYCFYLLCMAALFLLFEHVELFWHLRRVWGWLSCCWGIGCVWWVRIGWDRLLCCFDGFLNWFGKFVTWFNLTTFLNWLVKLETWFYLIVFLNWFFKIETWFYFTAFLSLFTNIIVWDGIVIYKIGSIVVGINFFISFSLYFLRNLLQSRPFINKPIKQHGLFMLIYLCRLINRLLKWIILIKYILIFILFIPRRWLICNNHRLCG